MRDCVKEILSQKTTFHLFFLVTSQFLKERKKEKESQKHHPGKRRKKNTQQTSTNESLIRNDKRSSDPNKFVESPTLNLTLTSGVILPSQDVSLIFDEWSSGNRDLITSRNLSRRRSSSTGSLSRRRKGRSIWSGPNPDAVNIPWVRPYIGFIYDDIIHVLTVSKSVESLWKNNSSLCSSHIWATISMLQCFASCL